MPATVSDIAKGTRDAETVRWSDPAIAARYPNARDGSTSPIEGYFDNPADATTVLNQRGALIGVDRDRFTVVIDEERVPSAAAVPAARLIDAELGVDRTCMITRIELSLEAETTSYELFG